MSKTDEIQQRLDDLRAKFASGLAARLENMIEIADSLQQQSDLKVTLQELFRQVHSLSGSAGSFGFNRLGRQSRQLELALRGFCSNPGTPSDKEIIFVKISLQNLFNFIAEGPDEADSLDNTPQQVVLRKDTSRYIFVVEDDPLNGKEICPQLEHFGYQTRLFYNSTDATKALELETPDALVVDIFLPEDPLGGTDIAAQIRFSMKTTIPILFVSSRKDWTSRLAAVRAGGVAYLEKPIDMSNLVENLDKLTHRTVPEPYRVLIVDDALDLANYYQLILQNAGVFAEVLTEPERIFEELERFRPELLLLDINFPQITGIEVAHVLKQHSIYFNLPIVFLSTETDKELQLETLQLGDIFLEKPVQNHHLISIIQSKISRTRVVNKLMYHDGLTGLLNHVILKRRLEVELDRCIRQNSTMSFVMLDLDLFKQVNDRYGHTAGDRVLKALANLLKSRLRKLDHAGRYGGEEFAIIMPDTQPDKAVKIMNELRNRFEQLSFKVDETSFNCSFSAGIASSEVTDNEKQLIENADAALYKAKEQGRNRVVLHSSN